MNAPTRAMVRPAIAPNRAAPIDLRNPGNVCSVKSVDTPDVSDRSNSGVARFRVRIGKNYPERCKFEFNEESERKMVGSRKTAPTLHFLIVRLRTNCGIAARGSYAGRPNR